METRTKGFIAIGAALVILVGGKVISNANGPSDQDQIQTALSKSIEASREGRPGGVMDKLSSRFKVNNEIPASFRQIAQFIKDSKPDINVAPANAVVTGDEARMVTSVRFKVKLGEEPVEQNFNPVTLIFRKESARDWVVIPTKKWKLAEVDATGVNPTDFAQ